MRILVIQHSAADTPAAAGDIIDRLGHTIQTIRIDRGDTIPSTVDADVLMMFGGAILLTAAKLPPWVAAEQELIRDYVHEGRRVLGICLGSQILASALGASVRRNTHPEVGWHLVDRVADAKVSEVANLLASQFSVLQWHQDTFDVPHGATHFLKSECCHHQGFVIDDRVFGFQFHLEANARTVEIFLTVSKLWQHPSRFVQSKYEIDSGIKKILPGQTEILETFFRGWLGERRR